MSFNLTFRYIDDVLSINNDNFHTYVNVIYPDQLEIKDTTESSMHASYLDILQKIYNQAIGQALRFQFFYC